ncbi:hypothetical protein [Paenibacillus albidus]|nr:hypothetical protein [Paenibacillus albidus]
MPYVLLYTLPNLLRDAPLIPGTRIGAIMTGFELGLLTFLKADF